MPNQRQVQERYRKALEALTEKLQQDRTVLAAIVYGSYSYDTVWEKSDIDLWIIMVDDPKVRRYKDHCLTEHGVIVHANLVPRKRFQLNIEGSRQGGWLDFTFARSTLLFSKDESIAAWYKDVEHIGSRDRDYQLLGRSTNVLATLAKAQKWYKIRKDYDYSFLWLLNVADQLASIECILNGHAPGREVIHQALTFNPDFFNAIYTDLIAHKKNARTIGAALVCIEEYLDEHMWDFYKPLLDYLEESDGMRTVSEMEEHFAQFQIYGFDFACEWLVTKEILQKMSSPVKLTEKSRVELQEAAYYYDGDGADWGIQ
ncbi:MAG: hypothetical protein GKR89_27430 [Candidatus Latescibacteria bacterium]|nr:hypothetical protein [Candidatus Latescibacterota bacterium]